MRHLLWISFMTSRLYLHMAVYMPAEDHQSLHEDTPMRFDRPPTQVLVSPLGQASGRRADWRLDSTSRMMSQVFNTTCNS